MRQIGDQRIKHGEHRPARVGERLEALDLRNDPGPGCTGLEIVERVGHDQERGARGDLLFGEVDGRDRVPGADQDIVEQFVRGLPVSAREAGGRAFVRHRPMDQGGHHPFPVVAGHVLLTVEDEERGQVRDREVVAAGVEHDALFGDVVLFDLLAVLVVLGRRAVLIARNLVGIDDGIDEIDRNEIVFVGELARGLQHQTVGGVALQILLVHTEADLQIPPLIEVGKEGLRGIADLVFVAGGGI